VAVCLLTVAALFVALVPTTRAGATEPTTTFTGTVTAGGTAYVNQSLTVSAPATLNLSLTWDNSAAQLSLFVKDPSKNLVGQASGPHDPQSLSVAANTVGTYTLGVKAVTGSADYTLTVTQTAPAPAPSPIAYQSTIGYTSQPEMYPGGVDVDRSNGEIFVADTGDDRVQAYNSAGTKQWQDGVRGPKTGCNFQNPRDVAVVGGYVYVADTGYNRIQVLSESTGACLAVWPNYFPSIIGISAGVNPSGAPVILATDSDADTVSEFSLSGTSGTLEKTYGGTKGSGTNELAAPRDAATDSAGDVYVADYGNDRIVLLSGTSGQQMLAWGSDGTANGQFHSPYGVTVSDSGNVYVADSNNERIEEFTAGGSYMATFGSPGTGPGQFFQLRRVAVGPGATPYVIGADLWNGYLQEFSGTTGASILTIGNGPAPVGGFNEPFGLTSNGSDVIVADTDNQRMEAFNQTTNAFDYSFGIRGFGATNEGFNWPRDITYASATNTLWVADTKNYRVTEFSNDGTGTPTGRVIGGKFGSALGQYNWIDGVAAMGTDVVVADTINDRVQLVNPSLTGAASIVWSTSGFNQPRSVAVVGNVVYVADSLNNQVVELSGTDGSVLATFPEPLGTLTGIAVSPTGRIWVSDSTNSRIAELSSTGQLLQTYGTLGTGAANFDSPAGLMILTLGSTTVLYVVDEENNRVETFTI
jgi:tripartite motif-containing protein 71